MTRLTTFASSIKNARTMLSVTNTRVSGVNFNRGNKRQKERRTVSAHSRRTVNHHMPG